MFHKVKAVIPLDDYKLLVQFAIGETKIYDCKPLFEWKDVFNKLKDKKLFNSVTTGLGGYGVVWNDELDLSCDELYEKGKNIKTPFDGLISMSDATNIWNVNESTFRKAIQYGIFKVGFDVYKYGKQWVLSIDSLIRIYGLPSK